MIDRILNWLFPPDANPDLLNLRRRIERHELLDAAYYAFIEWHGRPPTTRELWDLCPPEVTDAA